MGGKHRKNRQHLLFYGACLLIVLIISEGCIIPTRRVQVLPEGGTPIDRASMMAGKGNYDGALSAYSKIARSYPGVSPGDRALFEMGLIWAYPDNPKKNHEEALKYFKRLLHDFPGSPLKNEAGAWVETLSKIAQRDGQIKNLEGKILSHIEKVDTLKKQIKSSQDSCQEKIESYQEQIRSCQEQISALKEIDIGIEEKKRKGLPKD